MKREENTTKLIVWQLVFLLIISLAIVLLTSNKFFQTGSISVTFLYIYGLFRYSRKKSKLKNDTIIERATDLANTSSEAAIKELPIGVIRFSEKDQRIEWMNPFAIQVFNEEKKRELAKKIFKEYPQKRERMQHKINNDWYAFYLNEEEYNLYFFKITNEVQSNQKLSANRISVGFISVDNYDEATDKLDEKGISYLNSYLATILSDWAKQYNIFFKKISSDRYFWCMYYSNLEDVMASKFEILTMVRKDASKQNLFITLSMGISYGRSEISKIANLAQTNLDIALARGGDQVVIQEDRKNAKPIYYGGYSSTPNRRNRVRSRAMSTALRRIIKQSSDVYVMGHRYPDMDAIGAAVGVVKLVESYQKNAYIIIDKNEINQDIERCLEELNNYPALKEHFISPKEAAEQKKEMSLLIMVDYHKPSMSISPELYEQFTNIAIIDHHRRGDEFPIKPSLVYVEPAASSASEQVTELIEYQFNSAKPLTDFEATLLLAGIVVDTKNFSIKTSSRTFDAASYLKICGADTVKIQYLLRENLEEYLLVSHLVERTECLTKEIVIVAGEEEKVYDGIVTAKAADALLRTTGIEASFVIVKRTDGTVGISARSFGKINVQLVMEKLGGGGHFTNAATQIASTTIADTKKKLIELIQDSQREIYEGS